MITIIYKNGKKEIIEDSSASFGEVRGCINIWAIFSRNLDGSNRMRLRDMTKIKEIITS